MSKTYAIKFTSNDPIVDTWFKNQSVKSKSIEMALRLIAMKYGSGDLFVAALEQLYKGMELDVDSVDVLTQPVLKSEVVIDEDKKPAQKITKTSVKQNKSSVKKKNEEKPLSPMDLLKASQDKKLDDDLLPFEDGFNDDDILKMMSDQSSKL